MVLVDHICESIKNGLKLEKVEGYPECQHMQGFRVTKEMWKKNIEKMKEMGKDVPKYFVEGLKPCLQMFGLWAKLTDSAILEFNTLVVRTARVFYYL